MHSCYTAFVQTRLFLIVLLVAVVGLSAGLVLMWNQQQSVANSVQQLERRQRFVQSAEEEVPVAVEEPTPDPDLFAAEASSSDVLVLQKRVEDLESIIALMAEQSVYGADAPTLFAPFARQVLYLGSAETTQHQWTDTNLEITLDRADYPENAEVTFEAGLSIIGGVASARIVNQTTGSVIGPSEVSHGSSETVWVTSSPFALTEGSNMYRVQLRSSSSETARLSGARLVIEE